MSTATLSGHRVTYGVVDVPAWGLWYAQASLDEEVTLSGPVTLAIADLTLKGTVLSGGPTKGRSSYRIIAGAGGWGRHVAEKGYANDASDKVSTVLGDAAREVGETLAPIANTERVGINFTRPAGAASEVLQLVAPNAWYVDEAGVTRLGQRAAGQLVGKVTRMTPVDLARGRVVLAAESIATILPGVVVDGLVAVDVQHEISAGSGLRSTVYGAQTPSELDALTAILEQLDPDRKFRGVVEYRIVGTEGKRLNLDPVRVASGMPSLKRVSVRPGVPGCSAEFEPGSFVLVGFVDADRARPFVHSFEDADGDGFVPTRLDLCGGDDYVALAAKVSTELTTLKSAISGAAVIPLDGGASFKASLLGALASWPNSVAASKVKAT